MTPNNRESIYLILALIGALITLTYLFYDPITQAYNNYRIEQINQYIENEKNKLILESNIPDSMKEDLLKLSKD